MFLTTTNEGGYWVVRVEGEVDLHTVPRLHDRLVELIHAGHYRLIVDLEDVAFLDSTGLGVLAGVLHRVRAHYGSLHVICTRAPLLEIFRITGLDRVLPIHDSIAAARAAAGPPV